MITVLNTSFTQHSTRYGITFAIFLLITKYWYVFATLFFLILKIFFKNHLKKLLRIYLLAFFGLALVWFRVFYTQSIEYAFFFLNVFLAFIPIRIAGGIQIKNMIIKATSAILTFLFLPNSIYLVTDLKHLNMKNHLVPIWYDVFFQSSFAIVGIFLFYETIRIIIQESKKIVRYNEFYTLVIIAIISTGVYIGRFMRFHSIHLLTQPYQIIEQTRHEAHTLNFRGYIGLMTVFSYILFKLLEYSVTNKSQ